MILARTLQEALMASTPTPPHPKKHRDGKNIWRSRWYDDAGERHDKTFGYTDETTEKQAATKYRVWLATWNTEARVRNPQATEFTYSATDLSVDYLTFARQVFVKHDRITSHVWEVAYAMQALMDHYGTTPLCDTDNPSICKIVNGMVNGKNGKLTAKTVNGRLFIIKAAYRWARSRGLVDKATLADVLAVERLSPTRSDAKPSKEITPVDEHWVALTKPHASRQVQAVIDLQWLTGMRPGEAVIIRPCLIDMSNEIWSYQPDEHKMEHKGMKRMIFFGPRCQAIITPFLNRPVDHYLFNPLEAQHERLMARRAARKTKLWPSHEGRYVDHLIRDAKYSEESYRRAIHYACKRAGIEKWNPNQIRHSAATRLNRSFHIEDVSIMVGHADIETTRIYADPDYSRAIEIARKVG